MAHDNLIPTKMVPSILFVFIFFLHLRFSGGQSFLFDLKADPFETNIYSNSSSNGILYDNLVVRSAYWADYVLPVAEDLQVTINKKAVWKKMGGVAAWTLSDYSAPDIPLKYNNSDAPNIVFVLVDDWGWNDVGYRSTYMSWTTPTIDRLAAEGVKLENYYSAYSCIPARGALLTGRYPIRLGLAAPFSQQELPLSEVTLGQEMKSAGYRTYLVGKWHLGYSSIQQTPALRGFDSSYSYWNGFVDYWTKSYGTYNDLHDGLDLVTDETELSPALHNGLLMQTKAEAAIADHVANHSDKPMFLYYAMQLIHGVWSAPQEYLDRCGIPLTIEDEYLKNVTYNYCALNLMLDDAIANLTCALELNGMADNTVMVLVSDNGGEATVNGNSYPFRGNKGSFFRGGLSATGFVHSKLLPVHARGSKYHGQMHVTDWLPTLMGLATGGQWTGSLFGADLDGMDQWAALSTPGSASPRREILHFHDGTNVSSLQIDMMKLDIGVEEKVMASPDYVFESDQKKTRRSKLCDNPTLMSDSMLDQHSDLLTDLFTRIGSNSSDGSHLATVVETSENSIFNKSASIVMICFLFTLVVIMSVRLTSIMGKMEGHPAPSEREDSKRGRQEEKADDELTRLLR